MIVEKEIKDEELFISLAGSDHLWDFMGRSTWMYKLSVLEVLHLESSGHHQPRDKALAR